MKIIVTHLPQTPAECPFSVCNGEIGYVCTLRPEIETTRGREKPKCRCKTTSTCDRLLPILDAEEDKQNEDC